MTEGGLKQYLVRCALYISMATTLFLFSTNSIADAKITVDDFHINSTNPDSGLSDSSAGSHGDINIYASMSSDTLEDGDRLNAWIKMIDVHLPAGMLGNAFSGMKVCKPSDYLKLKCTQESQVGEFNSIKFVRNNKTPADRSDDKLYLIDDSSRALCSKSTRMLCNYIYNLGEIKKNDPFAYAFYNKHIVQLGVIYRMNVYKMGENGRWVFEYSVPGPAIYIYVDIDTVGDMGIISHVMLPMALAEIIEEFDITMWGYAGSPQDRQSNRFPFMVNPTSCFPGKAWFNLPLVSGKSAYASQSFGASNCDISNNESLAFSPLTPSVRPVEEEHAGSPAAYRFEVGFPFNLNGETQSHLQRVEFNLPEGAALNAASGKVFESCSDEEFGWADGHQIDNKKEACNEESEIGTVDVSSPLLPKTSDGKERPLSGRLYLGVPDLGRKSDGTFGNRYPLLLSLAGDREPTPFGMRVKLKGYAEPDQNTGRVKAVFENVPPITIEKINMTVGSKKGNDFNALQNSLTCSDRYTADGSMTPWSAQNEDNGTFSNEGRWIFKSDPPFRVIGFSPTLCLDPYKPLIEQNVESTQAGSSTKYHVKVNAKRSESPIRRIMISLPSGLLGKSKGLITCSDVVNGDFACDNYLKVGRVTAAVGNAVFEENLVKVDGDINLTPGSGGDPAGIAIVMPVKVGIFDFGQQIFRGRVKFRQSDAGLDIEADIPKLIRGVPVFIRKLDIDIERPDFMRNPSSCGAKSLNTRIESESKESADVAYTYQVTGCEKLDFSPEVSVRADVKRPAADRNHPALSIKITQNEGEAGLKEASVAMPKELAPDLKAAALKNTCPSDKLSSGSCPAGSVIGDVVVNTPLLDSKLQGPAILAKDNDGLKVAIQLNGQVSFRLTGKVNVSSKRLTTEFKDIPDVPIDSFQMQLYGGSKGILKSTSNLCDGSTPKLRTSFVGQNGKRYSESAPIAVKGCPEIKAKSCARGRTVTIKLSRHKLARLKKKVVYINGKRIRLRKGKRTVRFHLKGKKAFTKKSFVVTVRGRTRKGRKIVLARKKFNGCTLKSKR